MRAEAMVGLDARITNNQKHIEDLRAEIARRERWLAIQIRLRDLLRRE